MSNRRRREWLIRSRVKEIVRAGDGDELDVDVATIAEYKGLVRDVFGSVRRDRLRFPDNLHGGDPQGGSLVNIQARNRPPLFNLLFDDLHQLLNEADGCRLWLDYQDRLKEADSTFNAAMGILSKHRRVVSSWSDEPLWTAGMQRAARSINGVRRSVFQYADQFPSVLQSARKFWPECNDIGDSDVLALLAADQAHAAASILVKLIKNVEERAVDEGISRRDDRRFSMLLVEMSENVRQDDWYGNGKLRRARDLLRLAQLAESEVAHERGKKFQHRNGSGTSALYSVAKKILDEHGWDLKPKKIWGLLKAREGDDVIDEVTDTEVYWFPKSGSKATATTYKAFSNHVREMKKNK